MKPRRFDDYSALNKGPISKAEADRALRHYRLLTDRGMAIPEDLERFIQSGPQYARTKKKPLWHQPQKGRPNNADDAMEYPWLCFWAWHCFHFDSRFKSGNNETRHEQISAYMTEDLISLRVPDVPGLTATRIRAMIRHFDNNGFDPAIDDDYNLIDARLFCRITLGMNEADADQHAAVMLNHWKEKNAKV